MLSFAYVARNGNCLIARDTRKLLNFGKRQKMQIIVKGSAITFTPAKGINELRGFLSGMNTEGLREEDDRI